MKPLLLLPLSALAASCAMAGGEPAPMNAGEEASLSEALAGRVAEAPVSCVRQRDIRNSRSPGQNTILFDGPGNTIYVNRARGFCPRITPRDAIRYRTISTNVCEGELIRIFDPQTGVESGGCTLGTFTPYRRR